MHVVKIDIDLDACVGCRMCSKACFVDVIRWDDELEQPVVAYPEDCCWCLSCEEICTAQCIEVVPKIPAPWPKHF